MLINVLRQVQQEGFARLNLPMLLADGWDKAGSGGMVLGGVMETFQ